MHRSLSHRSRSEESPASPLAPTQLNSGRRPTHNRKFFFLPSSKNNFSLSRVLKAINGVCTNTRAVVASNKSTGVTLSNWAGTSNDPAVADVVDKYACLISELGGLDINYIEGGLEMMAASLQTIHDVTLSVGPVETHQAKLRDQIAKISASSVSSSSASNSSLGPGQLPSGLSSSPAGKPEEGILRARKLAQLRRELVRVDAEMLVARAQLINVTRERLGFALKAHLNALQERFEKGLMIINSGNHLLALLNASQRLAPGDSIPSYPHEQLTRDILNTLDNDLRAWTLKPAAVDYTAQFWSGYPTSSPTSGRFTYASEFLHQPPPMSHSSMTSPTITDREVEEEFGENYDSSITAARVAASFDMRSPLSSRN
ncbi:Eisosome component PIL1-domain-containing protein [Lipomyces oligophaga]|uniref:Eisosome component PIL1-domain-containing protein n=1 Tax=Lipomyces oligophaga TaxID=45792 RepID=UPI0034CDB104